MNKRFFAAALSLLVLTGCTAANNNATEETTTDTTVTTVETITEFTNEETVAETTLETTLETTSESTVEEIVEETVEVEETTTTTITAENVHDWENIDYTAETDVEESGRTLQEEVPFADYALSVIGDENIVKYFEDNSEHFAEFMQTGTSYSANVACIYGDFDKDGEQEYLAATNYGTGSANNIAIVDNGEVVYWAADNSEKEPFYKVCR